MAAGTDKLTARVSPPRRRGQRADHASDATGGDGCVESGHQFAVGRAAGGEVLVAFLDVQTQVGHLLFDVCDLLVEGIDVGWRAEPGLAPDLFAQGFG
jgi:hypothetical protein